MWSNSTLKTAFVIIAEPQQVETVKKVMYETKGLFFKC